MNRLLTISIVVFILALFSPLAVALENHPSLSAAEFFYGEPALVSSWGEPIRGTGNLNNPDNDVNLAASDFFYGDVIVDPLRTGIIDNLNEKRDVVIRSDGELKPENFYGYSDAIDTERRCVNC
jgi:hypothetical protein